LKQSGYKEVRGVKEKCHFQGSAEELVQLCLNSSLVESSQKTDFRKILEEGAQALIDENKVYTTAHILEARK